MAGIDLQPIVEIESADRRAHGLEHRAQRYQIISRGEVEVTESSADVFRPSSASSR